MNKIICRCLLLSMLFALQTGCATTPKHDPYAGKSARDIYLTGRRAMKRGNQEKAIAAFEALEANYPFGELTDQGQLNLIYAYYKSQESASAINAADRFIRLHPRSPHRDYAAYMKGIIKFNEHVSLLEQFLPIQPDKRDISAEQAAFQYFSELLRNYPDSPYAADARLRMIYLRNNMAAHELNAAQYYMHRGATLAAANRAQGIIQNYDQVMVMPDTLVLLVQAYKQLDRPELANDAQRVLQLNYPTHAQATQ